MIKRISIILLCAALVSAKKPVTVALIGYGADIEHPALEGAIWTNPKEKPANGRDDDKNGWVDDIHGWNFIGPLDRISTEGDRQYLRLRDKYKDYIMVKGVPYRFDYAKDEFVETPMPADREEFELFMQAKTESRIAEREGAERIHRAVARYMQKIDSEMRAQNPDREPTYKDFVTWMNKRETSDVELSLNGLVGLMAVVTKTQDWSRMLDYALGIAREHSADSLAKEYHLPEEVLGDNPDDLNDKGYGNANLKMNNAGYGTMQAGIVHRIAPDARIMFLRVDAGQQDESRQKDVALAIRYAVDKGAQIIQLGRSNTLYPYPGSQWVDDALRYASQKGAFVVQPVLDLSYNMDEMPFYPRRGEMNNFVTVAAADSLGVPLINANFGPGSLDMFARGVDVESTTADGLRAVGTGSYLAAAEVTGAAALLKSRFPKLKAAQLREILMSTVTKPEYEEVEKQFLFNGRMVTDLFLFDDLSAAHGSLNIEKALEKAATL